MVMQLAVMIWSMVFYLFASLGCAMATSIGWFLAFRVLQSAVIAGSALSAAIIRDTTEEREAANLLGYVGMAMAVAPMLAPMVGGVLDAGFDVADRVGAVHIDGLHLPAVHWRVCPLHFQCQHLCSVQCWLLPALQPVSQHLPLPHLHQRLHQLLLCLHQRSL